MSKETNLSVVEIQGVRCYIDKLGAAQINAEDAARGLGFVDVHLKKDFATSGEKYETVRWARVNDYLREFGYDKEVGKDDFIPEGIFYLLAMKANNEAAKNFQRKIAFEIMPSLRKYGYYALPRQDKIKYPILDDTKRKVLFEMVEDYIKYLGCVYDIGANRQRVKELQEEKSKLDKDLKILYAKKKELIAKLDSSIQELFGLGRTLSAQDTDLVREIMFEEE